MHWLRLVALADQPYILGAELFVDSGKRKYVL